jgi:hypothetical protein
MIKFKKKEGVMKVKDFLKEVINLVDCTQLLNNNIFDESSELEPTEEDLKSINKLVDTLNHVYMDVATGYLPLLHEELVTLTDGKINYSDLSKNILDVHSIKDVNNQKLNFKTFPTYVYVNQFDKVVRILYSYIPDKFTLKQEADINFFGGRLLPQYLVFAVAREYYMSIKMYVEAENYEKKFMGGLLRSIRKRTSTIITEDRPKIR